MIDSPNVNGAPASSATWQIDVQRGVAWTIIVVFAMLLFIMAIRVAIYGLPNDSLELLKQGFNALINVVMVVVGYFFGSSKSSQSKDETTNKIVEKLTSTQPPGQSGPVAPVPAPPQAAASVQPLAPLVPVPAPSIPNPQPY